MLVEEILGQGQDHQRKMIIDLININNLDIMQKNSPAQEKEVKPSYTNEASK